MTVLSAGEEDIYTCISRGDRKEKSKSFELKSNFLKLPGEDHNNNNNNNNNDNSKKNS